MSATKIIAAKGAKDGTGWYWLVDGDDAVPVQLHADGSARCGVCQNMAGTHCRHIAQLRLALGPSVAERVRRIRAAITSGQEQRIFRCYGPADVEEPEVTP